MLELKESITTKGWLQTSFLYVQLLADGTYLLVDGLHRLKAVLDLITVNSLPADFTVPCRVLSADTPANVLLQCSANLQEEYKCLESLLRQHHHDDEGYKICT
jgi:ParB-like chromosome segregation protein Spo0J